MNEIDRLKHEEQELMDDDLYSQDYVETLKIEEADTYERPSYVPAPRAQSSPQRSDKARWLPFMAVIAVIWAMSAGLGSLWALFLLIPAYKNWQRVQQDRQLGTMNGQTRKALRGAMFATLFAFMFMFNAWGAFFPLMLIGLGVSALLTNRWQNEPVYY